MIVNELPPKQRAEFKCEHCDKNFSLKWLLTRHEKNMHLQPSRISMKHIRKEQKYVCTICSKDYAHPTGLKHHIKMMHSVKQIETHDIKLQTLFTQRSKKSIPSAQDEEMKSLLKYEELK